MWATTEITSLNQTSYYFQTACSTEEGTSCSNLISFLNEKLQAKEEHVITSQKLQQQILENQHGKLANLQTNCTWQRQTLQTTSPKPHIILHVASITDQLTLHQKQFVHSKKEHVTDKVFVEHWHSKPIVTGRGLMPPTQSWYHASFTFHGFLEEYNWECTPPMLVATKDATA